MLILFETEHVSMLMVIEHSVLEATSAYFFCEGAWESRVLIKYVILLIHGRAFKLE